MRFRQHWIWVTAFTVLAAWVIATPSHPPDEAELDQPIGIAEAQ
ncbi:MAG: hypothetical protein JWM80_2244 [Cyanobacteria bacterium RYN_339]|nr:hypothetical protein [Cyanobacteria bacterium RYN_339]